MPPRASCLPPAWARRSGLRYGTLSADREGGRYWPRGYVQMAHALRRVAFRDSQGLRSEQRPSRRAVSTSTGTA
jgi:hypothetical protein